jgi:pimeloyl-ACP methyl ester carboxylesterase
MTPSDRLYRAGEGQPVVLLHPFAASWHTWRPILADVVARYEAIAPTLPGHGEGPRYEGRFTFRGFVDQVERQLDDLGVETAHFVASSTGGAAAIELAKRGRARSVVALSPGGGWEPGSSDPRRIARVFEVMLLAIRTANPRLEQIVALPRVRQLAMRAFMRRGHLVDPVDAVHFIRSALGCTVVDAVIEELRGDRMHLEGLDRVTAAVLLAWGEHDWILPAKTCSGRLRREIPGVEYRELPGVGHLPMWDDHNLVARTVLDWVSAHARVADPA